jgi:predicted Zn-dependent protease
MMAGQPDRAHALLLDLLNNITPTSDQARLIAVAANSAGDVAESYYYMSEYYVLNGLLPQAIQQLTLALQLPGLNEFQRARFNARRAELAEYLPEKEKRKSPLSQNRGFSSRRAPGFAG